MGFKMRLLWVCCGNPLMRESEISLLLNRGAQDFDANPLSSFVIRLFCGASKDTARIPLVIAVRLYLEELLLHKIWSPDCPGRALRLSQKDFKKRKAHTFISQFWKEEPKGWFFPPFNTEAKHTNPHTVSSYFICRNSFHAAAPPPSGDG